MRGLSSFWGSRVLAAGLCTTAIVSGLSALGSENAQTLSLHGDQIAAFKGAGPFGLSVAITSTTVFAGSTNKVDVFAETRSRWRPDGTLEGSGASAQSGFGAALSASGSTLLVGAANQPGGGRVYVFTDKDGKWRQSSVFLAPRGSRRIRFVGRDQRCHSRCELRGCNVCGTPVHIPPSSVGQMGAPR